MAQVKLRNIFRNIWGNKPPGELSSIYLLSHENAFDYLFLMFFDSTFLFSVSIFEVFVYGGSK